MSKRVANDFLAAAGAFDLSVAARDRAASRVQALGLSFDDPSSIHVVIGTSLEVEGEKIVSAINSLPSRVKKAATDAVGPVTEAAVSKVRADLESLGEKIGTRVGESVTDTVNSVLESRHKVIRFRADIEVLVVVALAALFGGIVGYSFGRTTLSAVDQQWQALASRADASSWFSLAATNSDIAASLSGSCGVGGPGSFVDRGTRACRLPVWIDAPSAPTVAGTVAGVISSVVNWLNGWSSLMLAGGGLTIGLISGLCLRRACKLIVMSPPIRWLLDI